MLRLTLSLLALSLVPIGCAPAEQTSTPLQQRAAEMKQQLRLAGAEKTIVDYWQETGLRFNDFTKDVDVNSCSTSAETFIGCVEGLNAVLQYRKGTQLFVPSKSLILDSRYQQTDLQYGPLVLVNVAEMTEPDNRSLKEIVEERLNTKRQIWQDLTEIYHSRNLPDFGAMISYVRNNVVTQLPEEEAAIAASAINAMMSAKYDPHTSIVPSEYFSRSSDESLIGIGVIVSKVGDNIVVKNIIENGPAHLAGIRQNDLIKKVNGVDLEGQSLDDVVDLIRGPEGTSVAITVERASEEITFTIVRKEIEHDNITVKMISQENGMEILYTKIRSFIGPTPPSIFNRAPGCNDWLSKVKAVLAEQHNQGKGLTYIVVDLRDNTGGYVSEAECFAGLFLERGDIITTMNYTDPLQSDHTIKVGVNAGFHMDRFGLIVLVNESSASASELLSSALQDHHDAHIIGVRTFGKGSFQNIRRYPGNSKINWNKTEGLYYRPKQNTSVQLRGVQPDFEVYSTPNPSEEDKFSIREDNLYINPIGVDLPVWQQSRSREIAEIANCMSSTGKAPERYAQELENSAMAPDFQLLTAFDAVPCLIQERIKNLTSSARLSQSQKSVGLN